jgi:fatty-acyl-CoA synthase
MTSHDSREANAGTIAAVGALVGAYASLHTRAIAIEYRDRRISYGELHDRVRRAIATDGEQAAVYSAQHVQVPMMC